MEPGVVLISYLTRGDFTMKLEELLPPLVGMANDWTPFERAMNLRFPKGKPPEFTKPVSIVIPVYNRKEKLGKTIAALTHSTYPTELMQVVIADDGSSDRPEDLLPLFESYFDIAYVAQEDEGYRLSEVRNLGIREAKHDCIIVLDCDMLPEPSLVEAYMKFMHVSQKAVLIGGRRYVNTDDLNIDDVLQDISCVLNLPTQCVDKGRGPQGDEMPSEDWRYKHYRSTNYAKDEKYAFRWLCGGNICIHRRLHNQIGGFDESFTAWGAEDQEYGFRLYREGAWFIPVDGAEALHQEPPGGSNETDRDAGKTITMEQLVEKCPAVYRKSESGRMYEVPKLTVYIPAYNCVRYIEAAVESVLNQTFTDLEVIVCNDGSTDGTGELLDKLYANHARVSIIHQENGGIGKASNAAIQAGRGEYVMQLDGDDVLLPSAAESLISVFEKNKDDVGFVYGDTHLMHEDGLPYGDAYSWSIYCRSKLLDGMRIHPPRMFKRRDYNRTTGFDEEMKNAVDYDFFLKLSEITTGYHLQTPLYLYRQHQQSTSKSDKTTQDNNTLRCLERAFRRNGILHRMEITKDSSNPRRFHTRVISNPEDYRIDMSSMKSRLGLVVEGLDFSHRWVLDDWVTKHTGQRSSEMFLSRDRFLRVGGFRTPRDAINAISKVNHQYGLQCHLRSLVQGRSSSFHFFVKLEETNDGKVVALRREIQRSFNWSTEIVSQMDFGRIIAANQNTEHEIDAYAQSLKFQDNETPSYDVNEFWKCMNEVLLFKWRGQEYFFEMPSDWSFEETHSDLFQLAHHLLVEPWDKSAMQHWNPTRKPGWRPGLAFSGGIDSAAAMALMPEETVLLYNERSGIEGKLDHTNALRFFEHIAAESGRIVHRIASNHEQLRLDQGKSVGFSTDYACAVQAILLADHFSLDSIATGMPLENSYLFHGHKFREFSDSWFWKHYAPMFESIGLPLYQPVAGCSEVVNLDIVVAAGWDGWAQSCLRSTKGGQVCGACWKCFRKNTLQGTPFSLSDEIRKFLTKEPLKQAASTLYSIQRIGPSLEGSDIKTSFPHLTPMLERDWSFLERYHDEALEMVPKKYRSFTRSRLQRYAAPMNKKDIELLSSINLYHDAQI